MTQPKAALLQGTVDVFIPKALCLGPLHGYDIIRLALAIVKVRKEV